MDSLKEDLNALTQEDKRWDGARGLNKHSRAKPYKRDKRKVNYYDVDIEDTDATIESD